MKKTIAIILICILIIVLFFLYFKYSKNLNIQEDFIFFKLFGNSQESEKESKKESKKTETDSYQYVFNVNYQKLQFKEVKLLETIDKNFLINGKIAPGTKGSFYILINCNQDSEYQVKFQDKNIKPSNLVFYYNGKKYEKLIEIETNLKGKIKKTEQKFIRIDWIWEYESGEDLIDTYDGKMINNYQFEVGVIGEQI